MSDQAVDHRAEAEKYLRAAVEPRTSDRYVNALIAIAHALLAGPPEKSMQPVGTAVRRVTERDS